MKKAQSLPSGLAQPGGGDTSDGPADTHNGAACAEAIMGLCCGSLQGAPAPACSGKGGSRQMPGHCVRTHLGMES